MGEDETEYLLNTEANAARLAESLEQVGEAEEPPEADGLAQTFFDTKIVPVLKKDGLPDPAIEGIRADFVVEVVRAREALRGYSHGPYRTWTGKVLTEEELQGYVEEAEQGSDVRQAYETDALVRGYALGRAHANHRVNPEAADWEAARRWFGVPK